MKVKSSKQKGHRIFKSHNRSVWIEPIDDNWWFDLSDREWTNKHVNGPKTSSYYSMQADGLHDVYSLKAAIRLIKKWNVPSGLVFRIGLPWIGCDFLITKQYNK